MSLLATLTFKSSNVLVEKPFIFKKNVPRKNLKEFNTKLRHYSKVQKSS